MGMYKLTFPGDASPATTAKADPSRYGSLGRRFGTAARVQPATSSLESPELEHFTTRGMGVGMATDAISEDDAVSVFTASTRTSNTLSSSSDDDVSLADFAVRSSSLDFAPARHSTACCTDVALRRELRRKFLVEPALDAASDTLRGSFAMGHSFRRELDKEDRVESLALWEEIEMPVANSGPERTISKDKPQSWHGDTASSVSSRNKVLESIFRKPRKSFFNGFFSGLTFSTSRRLRKS